MEYLVICLAALGGSALTFFSGFGLGTLLVPVFALFFPLPVAIGLTAIVHFLNNIFKFLLVGKKASRQVVLRFGIPSLLASFVGALVLNRLSEFPPVAEYYLDDKLFQITPVKLIIGLLLFIFVLMDLLPRLAAFHPIAVGFSSRHLVAGGLLSGFFGGLSGNQGALRSAFLIKAGLEKEVFIATGIVIACMVDIARLAVYVRTTLHSDLSDQLPVMVAATLAAFAGAFIGSKLVKKITLKALQITVATFLMIFSMLLITGII